MYPRQYLILDMGVIKLNGGSSVLFKIEEMKDRFTKAERKVAEYVLSNFNKIIFMSITELSDASNTSEGTLVRFCQKIGFSGFHPFKIALAFYARPDEANGTNDNLTTDKLEAIKEGISLNIVQVIEECSRVFSAEAIRESVMRISGAREILVIGVGASGNSCRELQYRLMRLGLRSMFAEDPHIQVMIASQLDNRDVAIAMSQSGSTLEVVDISKLAKKSGAKLITITGYERSPLGVISDILLLTPTRTTPFESGTLRSRVAQHFVIEALVESLLISLGEIGKRNIDKTAEAVAKWIY